MRAAPWSAVAAATAFRRWFIRKPYKCRTQKGGSCCYRTPRFRRHENPNRMKFPSHPQLLLAIFLVTLPLVNPWVRGDGVNYYAYVRSLLVQHNLSFEADWRHANLSFRM